MDHNYDLDEHHHNETLQEYYVFVSPNEYYAKERNKVVGHGDKIIEQVQTTLLPAIPNLSKQLADINNSKVVSFLPVLIFLGLVMILSLLSNTLVCYIYRCRSRRSTSNFFLIFFAVYDIAGCVVGIPAEILDLTLPYIYDTVPLCKIMGFLKTWLVCGLCLTLICVAFNCYKKNCRPNEESSVKRTRKYCIAAVIVAFFFSVVSLFVFDIKKEQTNYPGVHGKSCAINREQPYWLRLLYYICILFPFTISLCFMTIFYALVGVRLCKQCQAEERGDKPSPVKHPKTHRFVKEDTSTSSFTNEETNYNRLNSSSKLTYSPKQLRVDTSRGALKTSVINSSQITSVSNEPVKTSITKFPPSRAPMTSVQRSVVRLRLTATKQALIFSLISVIFVAFMLPFVVITTVSASTNYFDDFSSKETELAYNFCARSYLLNYLVKPIFYLIFNANFRNEVKQLFIAVWILCTRSVSEQALSRQRQRSMTPRSTSRTPIYRPPPHSV